MNNSLYRVVYRIKATLRVVLLAAILAVLVLGGYYITAIPAPARTGEWDISDDVGSEGVIGRIKAFRMSEKTANKDQWNLAADTVKLKDEAREMSEVSMRYQPAMKKGWVLDMSSRTALVQNASNDIAFSGEVVVKTSGAMAATLHTSAINWSQKKRLIFTDQPVRLENRKAVITGKGLVVDVDRQTVTVLNAVQAVF